MSHDLRQEVRALRAEVAALKAQLALAGEDGVELPRWAADMPPMQAAIVGALLDAHPRGLNAYTLEEASRTRDHVVERCVSIVFVQISRIRSRFGADVIETSHGQGYRLSDAFAARLKAE